MDDLFYNVPSRRKALKSASEEYSRILDVVTRYAIFYAGVSMTCRRVRPPLVTPRTPPPTPPAPC